MEIIDAAHNLVTGTAHRKMSLFFWTEVRKMKVPARPLTIVKIIPWASLPTLEGKNPITKPRPSVQQRTMLFRMALTNLVDSGSFLKGF